MGGDNNSPKVKMEIKKIGKKIIVSHVLKRNETYRINQGSKFSSFTIMKIPQIVKGYSNMTEFNKGILTADYDNVDLSVVEEDWGYVMNKYKLPPAYLFKTRDNYWHLICLKTFIPSKIYEILLDMRVDENYRGMPKRNPFKSYVIRLSKKKGSKSPKFVKMIGKNKNLQYEISQAHLTLLNKLFKIPKINYKKNDGGKSVRINTYETSG